MQAGEKLVILDDFILDVSVFISEHPGGSFVIKKNIGRDVSKFFYGGYSLENIVNPVPNYKHSNEARRIVNKLIIGKLIDSAPTKIMEVEKSESLNEDHVTQTVKFV